MPIAEVRDLTKTYQLGEVEVHALRGVSLSFEEGDYAAVMGPSGSGKSTLLNLIGCLDRPTSGEYYLGGEDVSKFDDDELSEMRSLRLGFIFQSYNLIQQLTVVENIEVPLLYQGMSPKEYRNRSEELSEMVGLGDRKYHRPRELSGGEQQRVAVCLALVNDPDLILADEPTGNLDVANMEVIAELLLSLARDRGKTVIVTTHDQKMGSTFPRTFRMRDGRFEA